MWGEILVFLSLWEGKTKKYCGTRRQDKEGQPYFSHLFFLRHKFFSERHEEEAGTENFPLTKERFYSDPEFHFWFDAFLVKEHFLGQFTATHIYHHPGIWWVQKIQQKIWGPHLFEVCGLLGMLPDKSWWGRLPSFVSQSTPQCNRLLGSFFSRNHQLAARTTAIQPGGITY